MLMDIYERLDSMEAGKAERRAALLLHGLGFTKVKGKAGYFWGLRYFRKNFLGFWGFLGHRSP